MKTVLGLLLGVAFGADLRQWDMVPPDGYKPPFNASDLGICYGSSTPWSAYPYAVALRYTSGSACCSGSIVSLNPGIIVSAAHCNGCTGTIRVGCNNPLNCDGDQYGISQFIQHPQYGSPLQFSNDVAVVLLQNPITTSGAAAIPIANVEPSIGNIRTTGYGITQTGGIPTTLQTMLTPEIERVQCQNIMSSALGGGQYVDASMVCVRGGAAGQENVPTMCSGDSGGPAVGANGALYGANSWVLQGSGQGCNSCNCCPGYPQVSSNTAYNYDFINGYLDAWKAGDYNYTYDPDTFEPYVYKGYKYHAKK